jgi:RNA polymerase sigma factor (sigma-70 family)
LKAAAEDLRRHPAEPRAIDTLDWSSVYRAILELDEREQTIVSLRFFAGLTHDEIAEVVGSTSGAVRTSLSRTLARLQKRFDPARRRDADQ